MLRFIILFAILQLSLASSPKFKRYDPTVTTGDHKIKRIIGKSQDKNLSKETQHIRYAPQDPVVIAGEYGYSDDNLPQDEKDYEVPRTTPQVYDFDLNQAKAAHYSFDASIKDDINDHSHVRSETRDGLKVTGMYSYSDGFFFRTVHYVADENGYRIIKQDVKKIGDGPKFNSAGRADIQGSLLGNGYSITIDNDDRHPNYVDINRRQHH